MEQFLALAKRGPAHHALALPPQHRPEDGRDDVEHAEHEEQLIQPLLAVPGQALTVEATVDAQPAVGPFPIRPLARALCLGNATGRPVVTARVLEFDRVPLLAFTEERARVGRRGVAK